MGQETIASLHLRFDAVEKKVDDELTSIKSKSYTAIIVAGVFFLHTWIVWTVRGWFCG